MWQGRFSKDPSQRLREFSESISFDWRLYRQDIRGSIAHARGLLGRGILSQDEFAQIEAGLTEILGEIERGEFKFDTRLEDIHMNIEAELTRRIGPAGARLHTARSRNDQVALDLRLWVKEACAEIEEEVRGLQRALAGLADRSVDVVIPGYTHLQRAQPVPAAHHLLAYVEMLERDAGRLRDARLRITESPLGSGAIAGSTIAIDRVSVARELGFQEVTQNSMDAIADRDFACEFLAALAIVGMHTSRLSEDVILWASAEFGFIQLSDAHTTGSSLMPQKKNPDVAELARGKTGRLYGNLVRLLTVLKGLPMAYNRDLQEDKEAVFDSAQTVMTMLPILAEMMEAAHFVKERALAASRDPMLLATDLADYVVLKGVPFRQAHEIVGRLVALSLDANRSLDAFSLDELKEVSPVFEEDVKAVFRLDRALDARNTPGAPSPANVRLRLDHWRKKLADG